MMITVTTICATVPGLSEDEVLRFVEAEWVRPVRQAGQPVFSEADLARVRLIQDLRTSLEVEDQTLPLVLDLLDQLYTVRAQLRLLLTAAGPDIAPRLADMLEGAGRDEGRK